MKNELNYSGLLVKELALKTGIHKRTIDKYLTEKGSAPSAENAFRIARALGVTMEYLVAGLAGPHCDNALFNLRPETRLIAQCAEQLDEPTRKIALALMQALKTSTAQ